MKKNLFYVLLFLTTSISAQIQNWIKDSKNAWVATFSIDVRLDMLETEQMKNLYDRTKIDATGGLDMMKFVEDPKIDFNEGYQSFSNILLQA
jgi:hypothetical protein